MIGQTISHYKILEKLGEGGMGIVYKAHDTDLDRDVALKFLPHRVTVDESEQARFLQEARAAAVLNHPNICTVHAIEKADDQQFIVMECVDGKTLRQMVPVQRIQTAIDYAIQIGEALQEAHSKGIVHRDVKTDNILVNSKNQVKVMDFGLAKLKGSLKLTKASSTVGTLAYMAPEQIEGHEVDGRSDIFSFGVVLYEMLTGHLPFRGEHEAAMVYSIVNEEPAPIQKFLPDAPSELVHILNRALEKDPEDRYQFVHEMVIDLRRLKKDTSRVLRSSAASEYSTSVIGSRQTRSHRPKTRLVIILAAAMVIVCAATVMLLLPRRPQLNPDRKSHILQIPFKDTRYAGMSSDGKWLALPATDNEGKFDIYLMNVADGKCRRITHAAAYSIFGVFVSPNADKVIYSRILRRGEARELVLASTSDESEMVLPFTGVTGGWCPDGERFWYAIQRSIGASRIASEFWTCRQDGSDRRLLAADSCFSRALNWFAFDYSPDQKYVAMTKNSEKGFTEIVIRDPETGANRRLTFDEKYADDPVFAPGGEIIFSSNRGGNINLWMVPVTGGEPIQVTSGPGPDHRVGMSADGKRLIYVERQEWIGHIKLTDLATGETHQLTVEDWARSAPSMSPSGKWIAYSQQMIDAASTVMDIYTMQCDGREIRKITDDKNLKYPLAWSPDEEWIAFYGRPTNEPPDSNRIYIVSADKPATPRMVGKGTGLAWFNEREFVVWSAMATYKGSIDRSGYERFSEDSIWAVPILNQKYVLLRDLHRSRPGWSITSAHAYASTGIKNARPLPKVPPAITLPADGKELFYVGPATGELHKVLLPSGKDEWVKVNLPGLTSSNYGTDSKRLAYMVFNWKARFIVVDDLFK